MKLSTLFLFTSLLAMHANTGYAQKTKVTLALENVTVQEVIDQLETSSEFRFVYRLRDVDLDRIVSINVKKKKVTKVLEDLFDNTRTAYRVIDRQIFLLERQEAAPPPELPIVPVPETQQIVISGTVTDTDGNPLPGANVVAKGTTIGEITDFDGKYSIAVPEDVSVLVFSYVGFKTQEVTIGEQTVIDVRLLESEAQLDEVVVIGYGASTERNLVGAVSQVTSEQIEEIPVNTFEQTLVGQVAGVQFRQTGNPGGGPVVTVRGFSSLSNNAPLYVVDGIIIGNVVNQNDNFQLNSIAVEDIESVSVLKDATAKAIYGSRASNGVVIITTKKGRKGKPTISFSTFTGVNSVLDFDKPNNLNALELAQFQKERLEDRYIFNGSWGGLEQAHYTRLQEYIAAAGNDPALREGTNWFDEITRTGFTQNHNFSINGGSDSFLYNLSAGYRDEEGVVINTGFKRYTLRANVQASLSDKITVGMNIAPTFAKNLGGATEPNSGGFSAYSAVNATNWVDPTAAVRDENDNLNNATHGILSRQNFQGVPIPNGSGLFWTASPVAKILNRKQESQTNTLNLSTYVEAGIWKNLKVRSTIALNYIDRQTFNYTPRTLPADGLTPDVNGRANSSSEIVQTRNTNTIWDNQITYTKTFNDKHDIDAIALLSVERRKADRTEVNTRDFIDEDFIYPTFGNTNPENVNNFRETGFGINEVTRIGILGRIAYNYAGKYYLTAAFRRDATSRFGSENRWGNFPSVNGAWRISEENFFEPLRNVVSDFRLEAGWGLSGNDAGIGNFAWQGNVDPANYILGGSPASGYALVDLANNSLTWEETEQIDLGVDVGLFNNRLNLQVDWYKTTSEGFLGRTQLPTTTGFPNIIDNVGRIENKGIEIALSTSGLVNTEGGFRYDVSLNFSRNRNELLELGSGVLEQPIGQAGNGTQFAILRVGSPLGIFRGFNVQGFYTEEDMRDMDTPVYEGVNPDDMEQRLRMVGAAKIEDVNGDGIINFSAEDYTDIGDPNPDFIYGMRHTFGYKNFDLSIVANGAVGQQIYDQRNQQLHNLDGVFNVDREVFLNRYRPGVAEDIVIPATQNLPDGAIIGARPESDLNTITIPTTRSGGLPGGVNTTRYWRSPNSFHIKDADYLWIRNITLGYTFSPDQLRGLSDVLSGVRLYASVQNPFVFSEYDTGSPEIQRASDTAANDNTRVVRNVNEGSYPNSTFYSLGLNVNF